MTGLTEAGIRHIRTADTRNRMPLIFERVVGRAPTRKELSWVDKGWIPGSLL